MALHTCSSAWVFCYHFINCFMVPIIMALILNGHSISDDLYQIFVFGTCTAFWWKWVSEKTGT